MIICRETSYSKELNKDSLPFSSGSNQNSAQMLFMSSSVCRTCRFRRREKGCGRFNLVSVFPLNYYHFNYSLQCLLFVSPCLITNLCTGGAAHSVLPLYHAQDWGCPFLPEPPRGRGKLSCAAGECQSCTAVHKSQEEARRELLFGEVCWQHR